MNIVKNQWSLSLSWEFIKSCLRFFSNNKSLMLISILNLLTIALVALPTLLFNLQKYPDLFDASNSSQVLNNTVIASLIALYFAIGFINLFFNSALMACTINRLKQQPFSISQGLKLAFSRIAKIFIWSLITSSIGLILNILQRSHKILQRILTFLLGFSWAVVSYFVLPLIVMDNLGPIAALKKSYQLFKGGWRKMFSVFVVLALVLVPIMIILFESLRLSLALGMPELVLAVVVLMFLFIFLSSILETIVNAALYLTYFGQIEIVGFDKELLEKVLVKQK